MKFWNLLRWLGTALFAALWLLSCMSAPTSPSSTHVGGAALPHAAPDFHH